MTSPTLRARDHLQAGVNVDLRLALEVAKQ
jgi:hypothetical protein